MAFTFFGSASNIADEGTNAVSPAAVTPPGSMVAGDLVVMIGATKVGSTDYAMSTTGGQTWNDRGDFTASTNRSLGIFWCIYNGTWSANPAMSCTVGNTYTVMMIVARPDASEVVAFDATTTAQALAAPSTPFDVTLTGVTTATNDEFVIAAVMSVDDDQWVVQTGGWTSIQVDNLASTDMGMAVAYQTKATAGATGSVVIRQTVNGGDVGLGAVMAWSAATAGPTTHSRSASLDAIATIAAAGIEELPRSAALDATATIAASGVRFGVLERSAALDATAEIASAAIQSWEWSDPASDTTEPGVTVHTGQASIDATAGIASSGIRITVYQRSASVDGVALIFASGIEILGRAASLDAIATIVAAGQRVLLRQADVSATAVIVADGAILGATQRSAAIDATASIQAAGQKRLHRQADVSVIAEIQVAPQRVLLRQASLQAEAVITSASSASIQHERSVGLQFVAEIGSSGSVEGQNDGRPINDPMAAWISADGHAVLANGQGRAISADDEGRAVLVGTTGGAAWVTSTTT